MRISLLNKREPFREILIQTLKNLLEKDDSSVKIYTVKKFSLSFFKNLGKLFFENAYLNFYSLYKTEREIFEVLIKEYSKSNRIGMGLVQKLYVYFAISKLGRVILSAFILSIETTSSKLKDAIILGGNHRIRVLKPMNNSTIVVLKEGFREQWIAKEMAFRTENELKIAPKLISTSIDQLSFEEEYTPGVPINRLSKESQLKYSKQAYELLFKEVTKNHLEETELYNWLEAKGRCIQKDFFSGFGKAPSKELQNKLIGSLKKIIYLIEERSLGKRIKTSVSHGDFQYANILLRENGAIVVIDWESVDKRWFLYDYITLFLEIRQNILIDYLYFKERVSCLTQFELSNLKDDTELLFLIYLLEEVHYQVLNSCEVKFYESGKELFNFLDEIESKLKVFL